MTCRRCHQPWYVAIDTVDDDYYFRRLSAVEVAGILDRGHWPADYDQFVNVWPLKEERDFEARLHWPWKDEDVDVQ
jgi:hypothetical protein